jgi:hypothetical protein
VSRAWVEPVRSLLEAPSPAVLTTYRKDGSAHTVPCGYRWTHEAFEVVIAKGDVKLRHLPATLRRGPPDRFIARRWASVVGPLRA